MRERVREHWFGDESKVDLECWKYQSSEIETPGYVRRLRRQCLALRQPPTDDTEAGPSVARKRGVHKRSDSKRSSSSEDELEELARLRVEEEQEQLRGKLAMRSVVQEEELLPYELVDPEHCETCRLIFRQGVKDGKRRAE